MWDLLRRVSIEPGAGHLDYLPGVRGVEDVALQRSMITGAPSKRSRDPSRQVIVISHIA